MSNKNIAIGTVMVVISLIALITLFAENYVLQNINPTAALAAITVAIIGLAWFKKTTN